MFPRDRAHVRGWWRSRTGPVLLLFLAVAAFLLVGEHRAHALGVVPWLVLLLCPLLHWLLHGRGDGHAGHGADGNQRPEGGTR